MNDRARKGKSVEEWLYRGRSASFVPLDGLALEGEVGTSGDSGSDDFLRLGGKRWPSELLRVWYGGAVKRSGRFG